MLEVFIMKWVQTSGYCGEDTGVSPKLHGLGGVHVSVPGKGVVRGGGLDYRKFAPTGLNTG